MHSRYGRGYAAILIPPRSRETKTAKVCSLFDSSPLWGPFRWPPKCPWGLYASPPPVAMVVVESFLSFSFFFKKKVCVVYMGKNLSLS